MHIDFIICPHRFLSSFNEYKLISITLKKQDIRFNRVEVTHKSFFFQQWPGRKNAKGTKILKKETRIYDQCFDLYLCIHFSLLPFFSNSHTRTPENLLLQGAYPLLFLSLNCISTCFFPALNQIFQGKVLTRTESVNNGSTV